MPAFQLFESPSGLRVAFGGQPVAGASCEENFDAVGTYWVDFDDGLSGQCLQATVAETDSRISELFIRDVSWTLLGQVWTARVGIVPASGLVRAYVDPVWETWRSAVSYVDLVNGLELFTSTSSTVVRHEVSDSAYVTTIVDLAARSVSDVLSGLETELKPIFERAYAIAANSRPGAVVATFEFPSAVASACEQYLIHFADFLRDVGIDVSTDLQHQAQTLLFTVTPKHREDALAAIREALDLYLRLPMSTLEGTPPNLADELTADKLRVNIHHLKAQLTSASMMLRLQEATISAQEFTIDAQQRLIEGADKLARDREALVGDLMHVVPFETSGLRINLPELLRRLKTLFL